MDAMAADRGAFAEAVVFLSYFDDLPDPRQRGKVMYPLEEVLLLALLAVLAGAETFVDIARFGARSSPFCGASGRFDGTPSHDHLGDIFAALDAEQFQRCFVAWIASLIGVPADVMAIDGKTSRRSDEKKRPAKAPSTWSPPSPRANALCSAKSKSRRNPTRSSPSRSCSTCWRSKAPSSPSTRWDVNARSRKRSSIRRPIMSLH